MEPSVHVVDGAGREGNAGGEPQNRDDDLRYIWFVEGDLHGGRQPMESMARAAKVTPAARRRIVTMICATAGSYRAICMGSGSACGKAKVPYGRAVCGSLVRRRHSGLAYGRQGCQ